MVVVSMQMLKQSISCASLIFLCVVSVFVRMFGFQLFWHVDVFGILILWSNKHQLSKRHHDDRIHKMPEKQIVHLRKKTHKKQAKTSHEKTNSNNILTTPNCPPFQMLKNLTLDLEKILHLNLKPTAQKMQETKTICHLALHVFHQQEVSIRTAWWWISPSPQKKEWMNQPSQMLGK